MLAWDTVVHEPPGYMLTNEDDAMAALIGPCRCLVHQDFHSGQHADGSMRCHDRHTGPILLDYAHVLMTTL